MGGGSCDSRLLSYCSLPCCPIFFEKKDCQSNSQMPALILAPAVLNTPLTHSGKHMIIQLLALAPESKRPSEECFKQFVPDVCYQKSQCTGDDSAAREGALSLVAY